jgi:hypothetical protein
MTYSESSLYTYISIEDNMNVHAHVFFPLLSFSFPFIFHAVLSAFCILVNEN